MNIGINANRARSGGAVRHLKGILKNVPNYIKNNNKIHLWSNPDLLSKIEDYPFLIKHKYPLSKANIIYQLFWERFFFKNLIIKQNCKVLINIDAGTTCNFKNSITMSRDMLPFEPNVIKDFPLKFKLRQIILRFISIQSLNNSKKIIFLTNYAYSQIKKSLKKNINYKIIPHGVEGNLFQKVNHNLSKTYTSKEFKITYISPFLPYKNQSKVILAVNKLKEEGYKVKLELIGKMNLYSRKIISKTLKDINSANSFIRIIEEVKQELIPKYLLNTDIFLFASSCENLPNTLLEGMSIGLPIVCSDMGPMPEILEDGGLYFNPYEINSIHKSLKTLLDNERLRIKLSNKAKKLSLKYTWSKSSKAIFETAIAIGTDF